jgi:ADP-ribose pyrophosphatase
MQSISNTETIYEGKMVRLEVLTVQQDGKELKREVVRHAPGVAIVALQERGDIKRQGHQVIMVEQFRPALGREVLEIVAGLVDEGEMPLEAAKRELREEVGLEADDWVELGSLYTSPGFTDEKITFFFARDVRHVGSDPDANEKISLCTMPLTLALQDARAGKTQDSKTVIGLLWAAAHLQDES